MSEIRRRYHSKAKTGCRTCKKRRVKCDESKPTCGRCASGGRRCGGYEPVKTWIFEPRTVTHQPSIPFLLGLSSTPATLPELRALSFFREQTTPILGSFSKFTIEFWNQLIPQLSQSESAVRQMTIVLATSQELASCAPRDLYGLALVRSTAFTTALKLLTQAQPPCSVVAILMCALLLVGYEAFQDPTEMKLDAVSHLGAGLRILEEHEANAIHQPTTSSVSQAIQSYLEPMYLQMEMMLSIFNTPIATQQDRRSSSMGITRPKLPTRFHDLAAARTTFFRICRWHYSVRAETAQPWTRRSPAFLSVRQAFLDWNSLLMQYNDTLGATDTAQRQGLISMASHWRLLMAALVHSTAPSLASRPTTGSPFLPHGGRMKTSLVDITDPRRITVAFIVDRRSLPMLEICDWSVGGLLCDASLRIWPVAEVRKLQDGRGVVKLVMSA